MQTTLRTERLLLRAPELRDGPALAAHFADWDVVKTTGSLPHPYLPPVADYWILRTRARMRSRLGHSWMIEADGDVIGNVSLFRSSPQDDFEIGFHIGKPWWGRGYATEAARAVLDEAARTGQTRLTAKAYEDNPASLHLLRSLGFEETDRERMWCMSRGTMLPGVCLEAALEGVSLEHDHAVSS